MKRLLAFVALIVAVVFLPGRALAVTYSGQDYAGADLTLANGDVLTGAFINVGGQGGGPSGVRL